MWGKFAQRATHSEVIYTTTAEDFNAKIWDPRYDILDILHITERVDRIVRRLRPERTRSPKTNNLVVASFVTSHARLRLYHFIEQVESDPEHCRLLYSDTDSIFYARKDGATGGIQEGEQLGDMKREYCNRRIVEFVTAGPKNYAYRHLNGSNGADEQFVVKVRGFELNSSAAEIINFEAVKQMMRESFSLDAIL